MLDLYNINWFSITVKYRIKSPLVVAVLMIFPLYGGQLGAKEKAQTPLDIPGVSKVSAEGVLDSVDQFPDLVIVDARMRMDRDQGFIEGSISLPDIETNCNTLAEIITDKDTPVLFYCNGVKCGRSANSSRTALNCGYTKIFWFRGGFQKWRAKGYPTLKQ